LIRTLSGRFGSKLFYFAIALYGKSTSHPHLLGLGERFYRHGKIAEAGFYLA
jgi:hypothetical protein